VTRVFVLTAPAAAAAAAAAAGIYIKVCVLY